MRKLGLAVAAVLAIMLSGCGIFSFNISLKDGNETQVDESSDNSRQDEAVNSVNIRENETETIGEEAGTQGSDSTSVKTQQEFTNLEIEISEGTLYIRSGDKFSLTCHDGDEADYEISGGTLYFSNNRNQETVLVLPEDESYEMFSIVVKNGHIYSETLLSVDSINLELNHGDADLEEVYVLNDSNISVNGGKISLYGNPGASVTADCQKGELGMAVTFDQSDYSYSINVNGGNVSLAGKNYNGRSNVYTIDNDGERFMDLNCTHGDISIGFK